MSTKHEAVKATCDDCGQTDTDESPCECRDDTGHAIMPTWAFFPERYTRAAMVARSAVVAGALAILVAAGAHDADAGKRSAAERHAAEIVRLSDTRMQDAPPYERPGATFWDVDGFRYGYFAALGEQGIAGQTVRALAGMGCQVIQDDLSLYCGD